MARTNVFGCEKCGYHAKVAGGLAEGLDVNAHTVQCAECRALHDAVIVVRAPIDAAWVKAPQLEEIVKQLRLDDRGVLKW